MANESATNEEEAPATTTKKNREAKKQNKKRGGHRLAGFLFFLFQCGIVLPVVFLLLTHILIVSVSLPTSANPFASLYDMEVGHPFLGCSSMFCEEEEEWDGRTSEDTTNATSLSSLFIPHPHENGEREAAILDDKSASVSSSSSRPFGVSSFSSLVWSFFESFKWDGASEPNTSPPSLSTVNFSTYFLQLQKLQNKLESIKWNKEEQKKNTSPLPLPPRSLWWYLFWSYEAGDSSISSRRRYSPRSHLDRRPSRTTEEHRLFRRPRPPFFSCSNAVSYMLDITPEGIPTLVPHLPSTSTSVPTTAAATTFELEPLFPLSSSFPSLASTPWITIRVIVNRREVEKAVPPALRKVHDRLLHVLQRVVNDDSDLHFKKRATTTKEEAEKEREVKQTWSAPPRAADAPFGATTRTKEETSSKEGEPFASKKEEKNREGHAKDGPSAPSFPSETKRERAPPTANSQPSSSSSFHRYPMSLFSYAVQRRSWVDPSRFSMKESTSWNTSTSTSGLSDASEPFFREVVQHILEDWRQEGRKPPSLFLQRPLLRVRPMVCEDPFSNEGEERKEEATTEDSTASFRFSFSSFAPSPSVWTVVLVHLERAHVPTTLDEDDNGFHCYSAPPSSPSASHGTTRGRSTPVERDTPWNTRSDEWERSQWGTKREKEGKSDDSSSFFFHAGGISSLSSPPHSMVVVCLLFSETGHLDAMANASASVSSMEGGEVCHRTNEDSTALRISQNCTRREETMEKTKRQKKETSLLAKVENALATTFSYWLSAGGTSLPSSSALVVALQAQRQEWLTSYAFWANWYVRSTQRLWESSFHGLASLGPSSSASMDALHALFHSSWSMGSIGWPPIAISRRSSPSFISSKMPSSTTSSSSTRRFSRPFFPPVPHGWTSMYTSRRGEIRVGVPWGIGAFPLLSVSTTDSRQRRKGNADAMAFSSREEGGPPSWWNAWWGCQGAISLSTRPGDRGGGSGKRQRGGTLPLLFSWWSGAGQDYLSPTLMREDLFMNVVVEWCPLQGRISPTREKLPTPQPGHPSPPPLHKEAEEEGKNHCGGVDDREEGGIAGSPSTEWALLDDSRPLHWMLDSVKTMEDLLTLLTATPKSRWLNNVGEKSDPTVTRVTPPPPPLRGPSLLPIQLGALTQWKALLHVAEQHYFQVHRVLQQVQWWNHVDGKIQGLSSPLTGPSSGLFSSSSSMSVLTPPAPLLQDTTAENLYLLRMIFLFPVLGMILFAIFLPSKIHRANPS